MQNERIPLIIPAYEPDERLIVLLQELKNAGFTNIVVLDDGSGEIPIYPLINFMPLHLQIKAKPFLPDLYLRKLKRAEWRFAAHMQSTAKNASASSRHLRPAPSMQAGSSPAQQIVQEGSSTATQARQTGTGDTAAGANTLSSRYRNSAGPMNSGSSLFERYRGQSAGEKTKSGHFWGAVGTSLLAMFTYYVISLMISGGILTVVTIIYAIGLRELEGSSYNFWLNVANACSTHWSFLKRDFLS